MPPQHPPLLPWQQTLPLLLLLAVAPFIMQFHPYPAVCVQGVYSGAYTADPTYPVRAGLIVFGLVAAIFALVWLVVTEPPHNGPNRTLRSAAGLTCVVIGWQAYPYWVNGLFQAYLGNADLCDFDPKALPPMIWIGDLWRLPIYLLFTVIPIWLIAAWIPLLRARGVPRRRAALLTGALETVTVVVWLALPRYYSWLAD